MWWLAVTFLASSSASTRMSLSPKLALPALPPRSQKKILLIAWAKLTSKLAVGADSRVTTKLLRLRLRLPRLPTISAAVAMGLDGPLAVNQNRFQQNIPGWVIVDIRPRRWGGQHVRDKREGVKRGGLRRLACGGGKGHSYNHCRGSGRETHGALRGGRLPDLPLKFVDAMCLDLHRDVVAATAMTLRLDI